MSNEVGELSAVEPSATPVVQGADSLSNEQLLQQIATTAEQVSKEKESEKQAIDNAISGAISGKPESTPVTPIVPDPNVQAPATQITPNANDNGTNAVSTEVADLQSKKGWKSPDDIAKGYINLQREFTKKSQELAELKRVPQQIPAQTQYQQPVVQQQPQMDLETANQQFRQSLEQDPIGTLTQAISFINARSPQSAMLEELSLEKESISLATNPKTADFTSPEITQEINTILTERPQEAINLDKNLRRIFYEARGRVQDKVVSQQIENGKRIQEQNILQKKGAAMEQSGSGTLSRPQNLSPNDMPIDQLKQTIENLMRQQ